MPHFFSCSFCSEDRFFLIALFSFVVLFCLPLVDLVDITNSSLDKKSDSLLRGANGFRSLFSNTGCLRFTTGCPRSARWGFSPAYWFFGLADRITFLLGIDFFNLQFHFLLFFCRGCTSPAAISPHRDSVSAFFADWDFCFFLHFFEKNLKIWSKR